MENTCKVQISVVLKLPTLILFYHVHGGPVWVLQKNVYILTQVSDSYRFIV